MKEGRTKRPNAIMTVGSGSDVAEVRPDMREYMSTVG
jgi:hypothetical protein